MRVDYTVRKIQSTVLSVLYSRLALNRHLYKTDYSVNGHLELVLPLFTPFLTLYKTNTSVKQTPRALELVPAFIYSLFDSVLARVDCIFICAGHV